MADNRNVEFDHCPNPWKQQYDDPRDAAKALRTGGKRTRGNVVYRCPTRPAHWHIGKEQGHPSRRGRKAKRLRDM